MGNPPFSSKKDINFKKSKPIWQYFVYIAFESVKEHGHFGVPKVVFGRKCSGVYLDNTGEYDLSQDATGIVDSVENLSSIFETLTNKTFMEILSNCDFGGSRDWYNRKIIGLFRKDFYKSFIH